MGEQQPRGARRAVRGCGCCRGRSALTPGSACLSRQLNGPNPPDINCADQLGNTPLHCAAYRAHRHCVLALLKGGADPSLRNRNGERLGGRPRRVRVSLPVPGPGASGSALGGRPWPEPACLLVCGQESVHEPTALCPWDQPRRLRVSGSRSAGQ